MSLLFGVLLCLGLVFGFGWFYILFVAHRHALSTFEKDYQRFIWCETSDLGRNFSLLPIEDKNGVKSQSELVSYVKKLRPDSYFRQTQ